jgi:hypothetical protein
MSLIMSSNRGFALNKSKDYVSLPPYDTTNLVKSFAEYGYFSNYCAQFAGNSSSYLSNVGLYEDLKAVGKSFTVECWIKVVGYNSNFQSPILSLRGSSSGGWEIYVAGTAATGNTGKIIFNTNGGSQAIGTTVLSLGQWYHVAAVYEYAASNAAVVRIYINGTLDSTTTGINTIIAPNPDVSPEMGRENVSSSVYFLNGYIDEFRFWHEAKTADQIKSNYRKTVKGNEQNLKSALNFEEGSGNPVNLVTKIPATNNSVTYSPVTPTLDESTAVVYLLPTLDKDTQAYYRNVISNSGTISFKTLLWVDEFVRDLKINNLWDKLIECGIYCGGNLAAALTKLKCKSGVYMTGFNLVESDYVERGVNGGIKGNGSNKYISSGYWGGFEAQNAHIAAYVKGTEANATSRVIMGAGQTSPANNYVYLGWINAGAWECGVILGNASTQYVPQTATTKQEGFLCIATNGSLSQSYYANGTQYLASVNTAGLSGSASNIIYLLASNEGGVVGLYSTRYLRYHAFGTGLSVTEQATYHSLVARLQSRLGRSL